MAHLYLHQVQNNLIFPIKIHTLDICKAFSTTLSTDSSFPGGYILTYLVYVQPAKITLFSQILLGSYTVTVCPYVQKPNQPYPPRTLIHSSWASKRTNTSICPNHKNKKHNPPQKRTTALPPKDKTYFVNLTLITAQCPFLYCHITKAPV